MKPIYQSSPAISVQIAQGTTSAKIVKADGTTVQISPHDALRLMAALPNMPADAQARLFGLT